MDQILAMREKRAKLWDATKAFLDSKRNGDGLISAEDNATYEKMEADVIALGHEIERMERQAAIDRESASEILADAIKEAEADGVVLPFAENAKLIEAPLTDICAVRLTRSNFLLRIVGACRSYKSKLATRKVPGGAALSAREKEALRLAAAGRTHAEVAALMGVQAVTAKKHLISAYRKLGAANRISAVKAAESLGII